MSWWPRRDDRGVLGINRRNQDLVFAGYRPGKFRALDDKLLSKQRLAEAGVPVPRTLAILASAADLPLLDELLATRDELVIKPARGSRGRGILVLARQDDAWVTPRGRRFDAKAIRHHIDDIFAGTFSLDDSRDQALVEARIHPARWMRELYPRGLSDLRIVVEDGEPLQAMLRVATDVSDGRANLHEGGVGVGIDLASARTVHAVQGGTVVSRHPDTGRQLIGLELPEFDRCLDLARRVGEAYPEVRYLGVDLVLDEERGPLVLEVNARPGLAIQSANARGQQVAARTELNRFDRFTQRAAWVLLLVLAAAPFAFSQWRPVAPAMVEPVRVGAVEDADVDESGLGVEWSDGSEPVSGRDDRFAAALAAVDAGDTTRALALYEEAAADSSLTPFALNNIALIQRSRGQLQRARESLERAVALYPSYSRGHYNLGLVERDLQDPAAAKQSFLRAVELRPSHARSWSRLGELYANEGDWAAAVDAFERSIRYDPDRVSDRRELARALLETGRPGAAAKRYQEALALSPNSRRARAGYLRSRLAQLGQTTVPPRPVTLDSLEAFHHEASRGRRRDPELLALGARLAWWRGEPRAALGRLESVEADDLSREGARLLLLLRLELGLFPRILATEPGPGTQRIHDAARWGQILLQRRHDGTSGPLPLEVGPQIDPVVRLLALEVSGSVVGDRVLAAARTAAVDATEAGWVGQISGQDGPWAPLPTVARLPGPGNPLDGRVPLPTAFLEWTRLVLEGGATTAFDRAHPDFVPRLRDRFLAELDTGSAESAHDLGLRLLELGPEDADVKVALAGFELERGRVKTSRELLDELSPSTRLRPDVRLLEARVLLREGLPRDAGDVLREFLDQDPSNTEALEILASVELALDRPRAAAGVLRQALQLRPERQDLREQLARALMDRRLYAEAEVEWRRLRELRTGPERARSVLFNLALCLQRQERDAESIPVWEELLALDPQSPRALYNLGLARQRTGDLGRAATAWRRALEIDPQHVPSRERLLALPDTLAGDL